MEIQQLDVLLRLVIAHLLADFLFQTKGIVKGKQKGLRSRQFYLHIILVGALTYLILAQWSNWKAPLFIMVLHASIDLGKIQFKKDGPWLYLADQLLHIVSLIILWLLMTKNTFSSIWDIFFGELTNEVLVIIIAYLVVTFPVAYFINYIIGKWSDEIDNNANDPVKSEVQLSLPNAGRFIGIIERVLILTFIVLQQWSPIGFLLAAKSVFRFGDLKEAKDRKRTEYILIGTLLSFTFSIVIGILTLIVLEKIK